MLRLDSFFADPARPEVRSIVDLIHRVDGFSRHDIERFGLGIFRPLVELRPGTRSAGSSKQPSKRGAPSRRPSATSSVSA